MTAPHPASLHWVKSSRSDGNGACVECAHTLDSMHVRDTKDRSGPVLTISISNWSGFVRALKSHTL